MAHYATPNIHASILRGESGGHLPKPKPALLQVEAGVRGDAHEVGVVDASPAELSLQWSEGADVHVPYMRYSTTQ